MTETEFTIALLGDPRYVYGGRTRLRYLVCDALDAEAKACHERGRPDRAGGLRYISSCVRIGQAPSKKSMRKFGREIAAAMDRCVDGVSVSGV